MIFEEHIAVLREYWGKEMKKLTSLWNNGKGEIKNMKMVVYSLPGLGMKKLEDLWPEDVFVFYTPNLRDRYLRIVYESQDIADKALSFFENFESFPKWHSPESGVIMYELPSINIGQEEFPEARTIDLLALAVSGNAGGMGHTLIMEELINRGYVGPVPSPRQPVAWAQRGLGYHFFIDEKGSVKKIKELFKMDSRDLERLQQEA